MLTSAESLQVLVTAALDQASSENWELSLLLLLDGINPVTKATTCCFPGCFKQEAGLRAEPGLKASVGWQCPKQQLTLGFSSDLTYLRLQISIKLHSNVVWMKA